jgi:ELWxxDGT repeat protein
MKRIILLFLLFGIFLSCDSVIWDGYRDVTRGEYIIEPGSIELSGTDYTFFVATDDIKTNTSNIAPAATTSDGPDAPLSLPGILTGILPSGAGLESENITDMAAVITLTGTYYGRQAPVNCLVRSPFEAIDCADYTAITVNRQVLSDAMGSSGSASLRVTMEEDGELISSNPVNVRKNLIRQVSNTREDNNASDSPQFLTVYRGELYFSAVNSAGYAKLFRYNDRDNTLEQISNTRTGNNDSPGYLTVYNNRLYFYSLINASNRKLFRYDEDSDTIEQVSDTRAGSNDFSDSVINPFVVFGNSLYLVAYSSSNYEKLFRYNDSLNSITQVPNTRSAVAISPGNLINYNNAVYFSALNDDGYMKLFRYDGTKTEQVSDIRSGGNDNPSNFVVYNGSLYFKSEMNASNHTKLFRYNSTTNTITRISNTCGNDGLSDNPQHLTVYNNKLYFSALNSPGQSKLYCYDGSTITQISNIRSGNNDNPQNLAVFNNKLYFSAFNLSGQTKLHCYDGSTITQVSNTNNVGQDAPSNLTVYNNRLYFSANNASGYTKLFRLE